MNKLNKVAIFGMGLSGKSALALAKKNNLDVYAVSKGPVDSWYTQQNLDSLIGKCGCFSEEDFTQHFHKMDAIVISPGIPVTHPALAKAQEKGVPLLSEIEFAWRHCREIPVVAITGTNGKTTTTTMITEALRKAGKKVFCGGNIGTPFCDLALSGEKVDYAVIEVSSFQLETIHDFHPLIGLILNIFPNHSERYDRVEDYAQAKFRLLKNMNNSNHVILGKENPYLQEIEARPVQKHYFEKGKLPSDFTQKFNFKKARVVGEHNEANFYAAYKTLELLGITGLEKYFQEFINEFAGVAHRLEFVGQYRDLSVYNDAKSTNALATTTAIKAFTGNAPLHLILGGKLRNEGDRILPDLLPFKEKIATIFAMGEVTDRLYDELSGEFHVVKAQDLRQLLLKVKEMNLSGNLVFSPAFPSFDQFRNYVDRGEKFKEIVGEILSDY